MNENQVGTIIVDCAVQLHRALGAGLLETVYEVTLLRRLERHGLCVQRQVSIPIEFEGERFEEGFRADMIVHGLVIVELKSVEKVHPAHKKQLLTYLKLTGCEAGVSIELRRRPDEGWNDENHQWTTLSKNLRVPVAL